MPEEIEQSSQPRGEDGRFVSSQATPTPPTDAPAAPGASANTELADAANAGEHAPVPARDAAKPPVDPYERARLALAQRGDVQTPPAVGDRKADPPQSQAATPPGQNKADGSEPPSPSPKDYNGTLSANEYALLKRVPGMLIDPQTWADMGVTERVEHIAGVKAILNERNARFNRERQQATQGQQPAAQPSHTETAAPQGGRGARDGVRETAPTQPAGQPDGADAVELPDDVRAVLAGVAEEFGADSAVYRAQEAIALRHARVEQQLRQQAEQQAQAAKAAEDERFYRQVEDQAFAGIADKYPQVKNPDTRDQLRDDVRDYFAMRHRQGRPVTPEEAVRFVTHNTLYPEIQRQQQEADRKARERSLSQTFDRGGPTPTPSGQPANRDGGDVYARARATINRRAATNHALAS